MRFVDVGDVGTAGLLGGFKRDAAPAINSFGCGKGEMLFRAAREYGCDACGTQLGCFFDTPLEMIELEDGEKQMHGKRGIGFELFVQGEEDFAVGGGEDFGAVQKTVGDYVKNLSGLGAEDAREVCGLVAGKRCGCVGEGVGDEAAARHES